MDWRKQEAKHNTARLEVKFFSFLLIESVRRDFIDRNPFAFAYIEKETPEEKPELSDEDMAAGRAAFARRAKRYPSQAWMGVTFEILLFTGCRFAETSIPMNRIDLEKGIAWMEDSKRKPDDKKKYFSVDLLPDLHEFLKTLSPRDRTVPKLTGNMNRAFNSVLKKACGATSHSCRVTLISRLFDAGWTEREVMDLINHSSRLVTMIYTRKRLKSIRQARLQPKLPPPIPLPEKAEPSAV